MRSIATTPPTTPPAMAPVLFVGCIAAGGEVGMSSVLGVGIDGSDVELKLLDGVLVLLAAEGIRVVVLPGVLLPVTALEAPDGIAPILTSPDEPLHVRLP